MPIDMSGNSPFQKGRLADGPTFADMRFLLLQFVTITKTRPFHTIQGETLPNCYKNSSSPEKYAATKERSENKGIHRGQHAQTPNPLAANAQKGGAVTVHRGLRTCPNGDA